VDLGTSVPPSAGVAMSDSTTSVDLADTYFDPRAEEIAKAFHESYELYAPEFGYRTRDASAVPWEQVPAANKGLMVKTARALLDRGVIR
jgi:hypothetical protein